MSGLSMLGWMSLLSIVQLWMLRKLIRVAGILTNHSGEAVKARLLSNSEENTDVELRTPKNGSDNASSKRSAQSRPKKASGEPNPDSAFDMDE